MMAADIFKFSVFALSSKGLMARAILPNNKPATKSMVATIDYSIKNITDNSAPVTGNLVVADVMYDTPQPWDKDPLGFYFLWPVPGTLWPASDKQFRIVLTFTIITPNPTYPTIAGQAFLL